jgi:hypothetical protein
MLTRIGRRGSLSDVRINPESVGGLGYAPLMGQCAFCQQALQFGFCFRAHAIGESIGALPVLRAERAQAHMQIGFVFFQTT